MSQIQKIPAPDSWDFHPSYGEQISRDETFHWLIAQGEKSLKERDFSKAIPIFEKILALGRRNKKIRIYANLQLAFLYEQMKNFPKVRSYFLKAVSMDPDNAELRYQFGQLLFSLDRFRDAVVSLRASVERNPQMASYRCLLARSLAKLGRAREATREFQEGLKNFSQDIHLLLHFALHQIEQNKITEAQNLLKKAEMIISSSSQESEPGEMSRKLQNAWSLLKFQKENLEKSEPISPVTSSLPEPASIRERFTEEGFNYVVCEDTFWLEDRDAQADYQEYLQKKPAKPLNFFQWRNLDEEYLRLLYWSSLRDLSSEEKERLEFLEERLQC